MIIRNTYLLNFRNFDKLNISLSTGMNIILGDNAQGKTNIMEAIYYSAKGRSFRQSKESDAIGFDKDVAYIRTDIDTDGILEKVEIKLSRDKKKSIRINEELISTIKEMRSFFDMVIFTPEDLKIIKDSKSYRRAFIDDIISTINPSYYVALLNYRKLLEQRNILLKNGRGQRFFMEQLRATTKELAKECGMVIHFRREYIRRLEVIGKKIHKNITDTEELSLEYDTFLSHEELDDDNRQAVIYKRMMDNLNQDMMTRFTGVGCHRDDIIIKIDGLFTRTFASQGQQRTALLTLKLAHLDILRYYKDTSPVILLDDVFSELDNRRIEYLLNAIKDYQSIITTTNPLNIKGDGYKRARIFRLQKGILEVIREG